jgi:hypothetical protein
MPEIECPQCGHRALSVATRCPRCGHEFPPNLIQPLPSTAERHWVRWSVMGAVALALIIVVGRFGRDESASTTSKPPRPEAAAMVVGDTTPRDTVRRDSIPPAAAVAPAQQPPPLKPAPTRPQPQPQLQPQAAPPERRSDVPPSGPAVPAAGLEQRYATVFVNVRRSRSPSATTTAVLQPGEAVLVDSLRRGWYRITRDGRVLGYADRRFLSTTPR